MSELYEHYDKVNLSTGEYYGKGVKVHKEPDYIKVYIMNLLEASRQAQMSSEMAVFIGVCRFAHFGNSENVPEAYIGQDEMETIGKDIQLSWQRVRDIIAKLVADDWLRRRKRGKYQINPHYVAKGGWHDIRSLQIRWSAEGVDIEIERGE